MCITTIMVVVILSIAYIIQYEEKNLVNIPQIPAYALLLDDSSFPKSWDINPCAPYCSRSEDTKKASRSFGIVGIPGHVVQEVYRLDSVALAEKKFATYRETDFQPRKAPNKTFVPPSEIKYISPFADEYTFGCGVDIVSSCIAIMRYGNYFVYLYIDTDDGAGEGLRITEVEPILRAMDKMASNRLNIRNTSITETIAK